MNWTPEQQGCIDLVMEQVDNPDGKNVIVSGSGGTGKTTIICELVCRLLKMGKRVAVATMTGKATAVLRSKINQEIARQGIVGIGDYLLIDTVARLTKKATVVNVSMDGETQYSNTWQNPRFFGYDILFIDELSMVPAYVSRWWQHIPNIRVFGFGDECQLPEIGKDNAVEQRKMERDLNWSSQHNYPSSYGIKCLRNMAHYQLHTVLRSDNEIANLCHDLRDFTMSNRQMVDTMKQYAAPEGGCIEYLTSMVDDTELDRTWQYICWTNKMCAAVNAKLSIGSEDYPDIYDKILVGDNVAPLGLYNGDVVVFADYITRLTAYNNDRELRGDGPKISVCFKWQGKMPRRNATSPFEKNSYEALQRFNRMKVETYEARYTQMVDKIERLGFAKGQRESWLTMYDDIKAMSTTKEEATTKFLKYLEQDCPDAYDKISRNLTPLPRLYFVNISYGYCITTHKAQGSEFDKVCYILEIFNKPHIYTGLSRAKKQLRIVNQTKTR